MNNQECNYCLIMLTIENYPIVLKCGHSICIQCIRSLRNNNIYHCPWDKILDNRDINTLPKYKEICRHLDKKKTFCREHNLPFLYFSLKTLKKKCKNCVNNKQITNYKEINEENTYIKDRLSSLYNKKPQIFELFTKRLKILNSLKEFDKKIKDANQLQDNIETINYCENLEEKLEIMNQFNIFEYANSSKISSLIAFDLNSIRFAYDQSISSSGINYESKLIENNSKKCVWLSKYIGRLETKAPLTYIKLRIESSKKIIIKGLGIGILTPQSSLFILNSVTISDNEGNIVFFKEFNIAIEKKNAAFTYDVDLQDGVTLISGKTYTILTNTDAIEVYYAVLQNLNMKYKDYSITIVDEDITNLVHLFYIRFG